MIVVVAGTVQINPDHRDEAIQVAIEMSKATQQEEGCVTYMFYADLENPDTFLVFEVWETDEALANHFQTDHMKVFQQKLPKLVAGPPNIKRYEVESVSDL
ncbi:MAG: putative quinol monooxygenase [Chloroflexota bacterium]